MPKNKKKINYQNEKNNSYSGKGLLFAVEKNLFNLNKVIVRNLSKNLGDNKLVLDFGAGIGTLAKIWFHEKKVLPECVEIDIALREILIKRKLIAYSSIHESRKKYDVIYSSNVLEHIYDDFSAIKQMHLKLKKNGFLCIFVPAFNFLYSDLDKNIGHYRRYNIKDMTEKLKLANFAIKEAYYFDSIGFFIWWLYLKVFKLKLTNDQSSNNHLLLYDKFIMPLSIFLDRLGFKFLFGKNLIVIAQKN